MQTNVDKKTFHFLENDVKVKINIGDAQIIFDKQRVNMSNRVSYGNYYNEEIQNFIEYKDRIFLELFEYNYKGKN